MHAGLGRLLSLTLCGKRKWDVARSPVFNVSHTDESLKMENLKVEKGLAGLDGLFIAMQ